MSLRALVVGAGPAGLAAARVLAGWCDAVTVVEARPRARRHGAGEHLPPSALRQLAAAGFASAVTDSRHDASPGVRSAWGSATPVDKEYFAAVPGRGVNLRRDLFDEALAGEAERAGASLRFGTRLRHLRAAAAGYRADLDGDAGRTSVEADLVVDASGRRAVAARALGATRRRYDGLVGLVGRIEARTPVDEPGRIRIEAVEDGWWYGVTLAEGTLLATFMTDAGLIRRSASGAPGFWRRRLRESRLLGAAAATGDWSGRIRAFDAATQDLEFDPPPGFLAVGDAATAWDPLSSWGITKGILDGHSGALALERERNGQPGALADHQLARRRAFDDYRRRQLDFYRAETRWSAAPFWRVRQRESLRTAPHGEGRS